MKWRFAAPEEMAGTGVTAGEELTRWQGVLPRKRNCLPGLQDFFRSVGKYCRFCRQVAERIDGLQVPGDGVPAVHGAALDYLSLIFRETRLQ